MTGKFVSERIHEENSLHGRWYLEVLDTAMQRKNKLHYHDTRNFGTMKLSLSKDQLDNKLESLGPDILDSVSTTEDVFVEIVAKKSPEVNVCKFLMDQAVSRRSYSGVLVILLLDLEQASHVSNNDSTFDTFTEHLRSGELHFGRRAVSC